MHAQSFAGRNRTLLCVLAVAGIFGAGCLTGYQLRDRYALRNLQSRRHLPKMVIVDSDGGATASRLKSELKSVDIMDVSECPDRAAAQEDLVANKIDIVVCIGPNFERRVEELDLTDVFAMPSGGVNGKLDRLDIEVETGIRFADGSETVCDLIHSLAMQIISARVLERTEPNLAAKLRSRTPGETRTSRQAVDPPHSEIQGEKP